MRRTHGFTLIEVMASVGMLGLLMAVTMTPLMGMFRSSRENGDRLNLSANGQYAMEYFKGQWRSYPADPLLESNPASNNVLAKAANLDKYNKTCFDRADLRLEPGTSVALTAKALNNQGLEVKNLTVSYNCAGATADVTPGYFAKRLSLTIRDNKNNSTSFTTDIARP